MTAKDKDTIYVDVDDEITTIIDKVRSSEGRVVALVLPKRASVFQSIVNMKLLKRAADQAKKHIVLVTTEANLMPLAGAVGLHVAATPQSKPEVPTAAESSPEPDEVDEAELTDDAYTADNAGDRSVGELARSSGHVIGVSGVEDMTLEGDEEEAGDEEEPAVKAKKDPHLKVPNFNRFRLSLVLAALGLIALCVGLYICVVVLPKGVITISTNTSTQNVSLNLNLDTSAQALDTTKLVVPAKSEQQQKTTSQQVSTTGQKNTGVAATGSITISAGSCSGNQPNSVPVGSGVSTNGLTFITQEDGNFSPVLSHGKCSWQSGSVSITAQNAGTKYNVSNATFALAGRPELSATGSASGGTDNVINIVAQADIDSAKQKLTAQDTSTIQATLEQQLRTDGMYPLVTTFNASTPVITTSANVGDQADNVTVTQAITYTMLGVKQTDLDTLITKSVSTQINTKDQNILDDGLSNVTVTVSGNTGSVTQISLQTVATIGPSVNAVDVKKQAEGKRAGDVQSMLNAIPGVTSVDVRLSPFWVSTVPTDPSKITVTIGKS